MHIVSFFSPLVPVWGHNLSNIDNVCNEGLADGVGLSASNVSSMYCWLQLVNSPALKKQDVDICSDLQMIHDRAFLFEPSHGM